MNYELKIMNYGIVIAITIAVLYSLFFIHHSGGQATPEFMVTWRARAYVPSDYRGKILPSPTSPIEFAFELLENGRIINLSNNEIRWYINNKFQKSGLGLKILTYAPPRPDTGNRILKIEVRNYRGQHWQEFLTIPTTRPEVMILPTGSNSFKALPYFFNVAGLQNLSFNWRVNNQNPEGLPENPDLLTIAEAPSGTELSIDLIVRNLGQIIELASHSIKFITE